MEEVIRKLEKRIDHLQYEEIKRLQEDNQNFKLQLKENSILTKQTIDVCDKLSNTMDSIRDTMIQITESVKDSNKISSELTNTVGKLNNKVDGLKDNMDVRFQEVDKKINEVDNKTKIDIASEQTNKFKEVISKIWSYGGGIGFIVMLLIEVFTNK